MRDQSLLTLPFPFQNIGRGRGLLRVLFTARFARNAVVLSGADRDGEDDIRFVPGAQSDGRRKNNPGFLPYGKDDFPTKRRRCTGTDAQMRDAAENSYAYSEKRKFVSG